MQKYVAMFLFASLRLMITLFLCNLLFSFQDESCYKNLLQDLAQREGYGLQTYCTEKYGEAHAPIFVSTVEIEGEIFTGAEAKTKKQAEMSAAKVAYTALKQVVSFYALFYLIQSLMLQVPCKPCLPQNLKPV